VDLPANVKSEQQRCFGNNSGAIFEDGNQTRVDTDPADPVFFFSHLGMNDGTFSAIAPRVSPQTPM